MGKDYTVGSLQVGDQTPFMAIKPLFWRPAAESHSLHRVRNSVKVLI
jgi:hypothetical protein